MVTYICWVYNISSFLVRFELSADKNSRLYILSQPHPKFDKRLTHFFGINFRFPSQSHLKCDKRLTHFPDIDIAGWHRFCWTTNTGFLCVLRVLHLYVANYTRLSVFMYIGIFAHNYQNLFLFTIITTYMRQNESVYFPILFVIS